MDAPGGHDNEIEAFDIFKQVVDEENAFAFIGAAFADGQQARQPSPGLPVLRIGEDVGRAVGEYEPRADGEFQFRLVHSMLGIQFANFFIQLLRLHVRPHHAGNRIAVGDADPGQAQKLCLLDQILAGGMRHAKRKNWS